MTWIILTIVFIWIALPALLIVAACMAASNDNQGKDGVCSEPTKLGYEAGEE